MILMYAVKATGTLRVSKEGELEGLDLHEHGGSAYPEILIGSGHGVPSTTTAPAQQRRPRRSELSGTSRWRAHARWGAGVRAGGGIGPLRVLGLKRPSTAVTRTILVSTAVARAC